MVSLVSTTRTLRKLFHILEIDSSVYCSWSITTFTFPCNEEPCASGGFEETISFSLLVAKTSRKLTFLYLANDVIQNSKKKGPEFTKDFESVLVDACSHVAR